MSTTNYQNHQHAAELHNASAHAHLVAEQNGQQDHLAGHEHSRQALEHSSGAANHETQAAVIAHGITPFGHRDIAILAHELWRARGCPEGTSEEDWFHAAEELRSKAHTPKVAP